MRLLVVADEAPPVDAPALVAGNRPDAVITLGDLPRDWLLTLSAIEIPRIGVHGNHDGEHALGEGGVVDVHLSRTELGEWSFAGFEGCVRYSTGPHQYTQEEAENLARDLPAADVLLCHCPPAGVNDEPDDPAHTGFVALRDWVERNRPRHLLHGHTGRTRVGRRAASGARRSPGCVAPGPSC